MFVSTLGDEDFEVDSSFLDGWAKLSPEELVEEDLKIKEEAKRKRMAQKRPPEEHCASEIDKLLAVYPELAMPGGTHWSLVLVRMVEMTKYKPSDRSILLRPSSLPFDLEDLPAVTLVQKHMSAACFDEIINHISDWATDNPDALDAAAKALGKEEPEFDDLEATLAENKDDSHTLVYKKDSDQREGLDQSHPEWGEW